MSESERKDRHTGSAAKDDAGKISQTQLKFLERPRTAVSVHTSVCWDGLSRRRNVAVRVHPGPARRGGRQQQGQPERDQESKNATMNADCRGEQIFPRLWQGREIYTNIMGKNQEVECRTREMKDRYTKKFRDGSHTNM